MSEMPVRQPAVAGMFYPADAGSLRSMIREYVDDATLPQGLGLVRAVIAPHAGYVYSGPIAGYAFRALAGLPAKHWTVFLLGPAHRVAFTGVALGEYSAFRTPLGNVAIAVERVSEMLARSRLYTRGSEAHAAEHCLEVQVPFLQMTLPDIELVPMLFGDVDPKQVALELSGQLSEDDLIVVSSDLSHYHPYAKAQTMDNSLLEALLAGDPAGVLGGEACGSAPMATAMELAHRRRWTPHLLDYRNSGDTAGDKWQVVGYASVAYVE
jgi:AmmeMemoRadiSam system protein B